MRLFKKSSVAPPQLLRLSLLEEGGDANPSTALPGLRLSLPSCFSECNIDELMAYTETPKTRRVKVCGVFDSGRLGSPFSTLEFLLSGGNLSSRTWGFICSQNATRHFTLNPDAPAKRQVPLLMWKECWYYLSCNLDSASEKASSDPHLPQRLCAFLAFVLHYGCYVWMVFLVTWAKGFLEESH
ncbi:PDZ domain-containing protein [Caerostris extrusa]|uniref:PDZ domain-containing protein n=1 Tax=Caerostris extrusa TaxID=172846 RepID=A0AAV4VXL6_CAEEX|nr:PDZ domain-containing protein [Caerostris extrusa]